MTLVQRTKRTCRVLLFFGRLSSSDGPTLTQESAFELVKFAGTHAGRQDDALLADCAKHLTVDIFSDFVGK
ncbi:hypothetical protein BS17DRAFT_468830 [Gyrodon lividus]|nr:hypothetical protein BS17DRAFT_468830 [Gyrodon lividus]